MGPEDKIEFTESLTADKGFIPGLDVDPNSTISSADSKDSKKVPYSKPIPRNFQAHWNDTGKMDDEEPQPRDVDNRDYPRAPPVEQPVAVPQPTPQPVQTICGILVYEKFIPVVPGSRLAQAVDQGTNALNKYISSGELEEVKDLLPKEESKSPPVKKSRFEPITDHKAVIIYNDTAESRQYQNIEATSPNPANTNIPSLLGLKVSNPEGSQVKSGSVERDWNGGRFNENDRNNSNNNNSNNNNNINNSRSNGRNSRFTDNNRSGNAGGGGADSRRRRRRH